MSEMKYTKEDLKMLQSLPLDRKIIISKLRISEWYEHWQGKVSVNYSGGKDSTVLLRLIRELYPEVPAVYVDTCLDYPEVREHVKRTANVIYLTPKMNFRDVIKQYGFCYPGKEVAQAIEDARNGREHALRKFAGKNADGSRDIFGERNYARWSWLINAPIKISAKCCGIMKEKPLDEYHKQTGTAPYIGLLATDSFRRRRAWYMAGCNAFNQKKSKPLSIWTEQDILHYIKKYNVEIASAYGEIIIDKNGKYRTTREKRTGCIFCPIGAHLDNPNHFQRLRESHPALYRYCMKELGLDEFLTAVGVEH